MGSSAALLLDGILEFMQIRCFISHESAFKIPAATKFSSVCKGSQSWMCLMYISYETILTILMIFQRIKYNKQTSHESWSILIVNALLRASRNKQKKDICALCLRWIFFLLYEQNQLMLLENFPFIQMALLLCCCESCPELSCKLQIRNTAPWTLIWANLDEGIMTYSLVSLMCVFDQ